MDKKTNNQEMDEEFRAGLSSNRFTWTQRVWIFIATMGGIGFIPFAPGTFGSLSGILFASLIGLLKPSYMFFVMVIFFVVSVIASHIASKAFGSQDPGVVVIDEALGMTVSLFWITIDAKGLVIGFLLFRALDILKPYPINRVEKAVRGGLGIVMDDLVAGLIANCLIRLIFLL